MQPSLADRLDALLPQTQCTQCGYRDCRGYAEALASGEADIDQCPPGGDAGLALLATALGRAPKPLNPAHGEHRPRTLALIDELNCIGCTLCIQACPVDAIVGAAKQMHTVLADECSGCELCLPACPVDCIELVEAPAARGDEAQRWRKRHQFRDFRLLREQGERSERLAAKALAKQADPQFADAASQAKLTAALARHASRLAEAPAVAATAPVDAKAARIAEMMLRAKRLREGG